MTTKHITAEKVSEYDAQRRARFLLRWMDGNVNRGQFWFGTAEALVSMLHRCGFDADQLKVA